MSPTYASDTFLDRYDAFCAAQRKPLASQRWTFCGIQLLGGFAQILVNDEAHSTRSLVTYRSDQPVKITYRGRRRFFVQEVAA